MASFRYRAVALSTGQVRTGIADAETVGAMMQRLRGEGLLPIEVKDSKTSGSIVKGPQHVSGAMRKGLPNALGELAVLLEAGLPLDRALLIVVEHIPQPALKAAFTSLRERVKTGVPLSCAMAETEGLFPPMACALAEAGEASGKLEAALGRMASSLERAESLRQTVISALVYPCLLLMVAVGVILVMLLVVVPQFESVLGDMGDKLPFATAMLMRISRGVREWGGLGIIAIIAAGAMAVRMLRRPNVRGKADRMVLKLPLFGQLVANAETARLAQTLGSLVEAGVPLPNALAIAGRALKNSFMAEALARVAEGVNQGGGLSGPLAATGAFPPVTISFLRTGEETAQLGRMLERLGEVLDRDVRTVTQRLITVMTPLITVVMGVVVASIIAAIFSAILGINDLAIQS